MEKKTVDISKLAAREAKRLTKLLQSCEVSETRMKALASVIENVAWMKIKLDETRAGIEADDDNGVAVPYDNGGGQSGVRENPMFKGYESLWKSYMSGMDKILAALPAEVVKAETKEEAKPKSILELVRDKHKKEA